MPTSLRPGTSNIYDLSRARRSDRGFRPGLDPAAARGDVADPRIEWGSSHYHEAAIRDDHQGATPKPS